MCFTCQSPLHCRIPTEHHQRHPNVPDLQPADAQDVLSWYIPLSGRIEAAIIHNVAITLRQVSHLFKIMVIANCAFRTIQSNFTTPSTVVTLVTLCNTLSSRLGISKSIISLSLIDLTFWMKWTSPKLWYGCCAPLKQRVNANKEENWSWPLHDMNGLRCAAENDN